MNHSSLALRRQQLHSSIRQETMKGHMNQVRQELLLRQSHQILDNLISQSETTPTQKQIQTLINFANQNQNNAIIHLANLLIDHKITPEQIGTNIRLGKSDYWYFLIRVLGNQGYYQPLFIEFCIERLKAKKCSLYSTKECISYIQMLLKQNISQFLPIITEQIYFIQSLIWLSIKHPDRNVNLSSLMILQKIISYSTEKNQNFISFFSSNSGRKCLSDIRGLSNFFTQIFLKSQIQIRVLGVKMLTNLALNSFFLPETVWNLMNIMGNQKDLMKVQISYFWVAFFSESQQESLKLLVNKKILVLLNLELKDSSGQLKSNLLHCFEIVAQRMAKWGNLREMIRVYLSSEGIVRQLSNGSMEEE